MNSLPPSFLHYVCSHSNAMMVGDKRKYNCVLVTLRCAPDGDGGFTNELAGASKDVDSACQTVEEAKNSSAWQAHIEEAIKVGRNFVSMFCA